MLTSATFVIAVFMSIGAAVSEQQDFWWTRHIETSKTSLDVEESATIIGEVIVMKSADEILGEADIYRSISYHDFENDVLAIRNLDAKNGVNVCVLTKPKKDFATTYAVLKQRNEEGKAEKEDPAQHFRVEPKKIFESGSNAIDTIYCKDATMYRLVPIKDIEDLLDIGSTRCIYGPLIFGRFRNSAPIWA